MSKNRRNFHYHYAEQYETRAERRARARRRARFSVAPVALIPALVLLMLLGLMSTAFSSYVQSPDSVVSEASRSSAALAELRNTVGSAHSASRIADLAPSGAQAELSGVSADDPQSGLASTGADADLSDSAANVDLSSTGSTYPSGMKLYIKPSSNWKESSATFKVHVWDDSSHNADSAVATQCSFDSDYYVAVVPDSSYTWTHYKWRRMDSSGTSDWGWADRETSNNANAYWNDGWDSNGGFFNILVGGDTFYFDQSQASGASNKWTKDNAIIYCNGANNTGGAKTTATQIATDLYKYSIPSNEYWDNADAYFWRGNASSLWNRAKNIPKEDYNFGTKNAVSVTAVSNDNGTTGLLTLSGLSTPTITGDHEFKSDEAFEVEVLTDSVLNYSFDNASRTAGLIDAVYTFILDDTVTLQSGSSNSYTFPVDYFEDDCGTHTVKVTVSSAASGMSPVTSASTTLTVMDANTCEILVDGNTTKTISSMAVNEIQSVTISALAPHTTENITITGIPGYLAVATASGDFTTSSINVQSGSTVRVKALAPKATASTISAVCSVSHANSIHADIVVSAIATPTITYPANSYELFYDSSVAVGSLTYSPASELGAPVTYSIVTTNTGSDVASTLASTDGTNITGLTTVNSNTTHYLKITVAFNSVYSVTEYKPVTIKARPNCYLLGFSSNNWATNSSTIMTYEGAGIYTKSVWLDHGKVYGQSNNNEGMKIHYDGDYFSSNNGGNYWFTTTNTSETLYRNTGNNMYVNTNGGYDGYYTFTFNATTGRLSVEYPSSVQYYLLNSKDGWGISADKMLNPAGDTKTYSFTAAEDYQFKIYCTDGSYFSINTALGWNEYAGPYNLVTGQNNTDFRAWYAGDYTFSFSNLSTSGCTFAVTSVPTRTVTNVDYFLNTTNSVPTGNRGEVTITDNHNDTWTVSVPAAQENDYYTFANWNNVVTGITTTNGASTGTVTTSTSTTTVNIISYWQNKTYTLTLYSRGATLPTNLTGATYSNTEGSGDDLRYIYTYTYGTAVTLPGSTPFSSYDSSWTFGNWYENSSDFSGAGLTAISNTSFGNKILYPKLSMHVYFKDNITGSVIKDETVLWNGSATAPTLGTGANQLNVNAYSGFTVNTSENYWVGDSFTNVKTAKTVYALYRPITETNVVTGTFTPMTNVTYDSVNDLYQIAFGAVLAADFTADSAYISAPQTLIKYQYRFVVNGTQVGSLADMTKGSVVNNKQQWTAEFPNVATMMTRPTGVLGNGTVQIIFTTYFEDQRGTTVYSGGTENISVTYQVITPLQSFSITPNQRIYSPSNLPSLTATFTSYHNNTPTDVFTDATKYRAVLKKQGNTELGSVGLTHVSGENYIANFNTLVSTDFASLGVKYYSMEFQRKEEGQNYFVVDTTASDTIHTTVGTTDSFGSRPVFFNADASCSGYGVMALYVNSGSLSLQTGESFSRTGRTETIYRFNVPSSVTNVTFALVDTNVDYMAPAVSGSSIVFTGVSGNGKYFKAYAAVDVSAHNSVTGTLSSNTLTCISADLS